MFQYPATELFSANGIRRVVWSAEEYAAALQDGWLEVRPAQPPVVAEPAPEPKPEPAPAKGKRK